jgi:hypothetical protein
MIGQFPRITTPRVRPLGLGSAPRRTNGQPMLMGGPRRMVYGAPHTPFRFAENHAPVGIPWSSHNSAISPPSPTPVWTDTDMIPQTPGFEGAPFGPGLEGVDDLTPLQFEAIRQEAERVGGRPIPTETELRARLGPSFNLSRYRESVERLANLHAGYPLRMPDGSTLIVPKAPPTSGPSMEDQLVKLLEGVKKVAVPLAVLAGVLLVLPHIARARR